MATMTGDQSKAIPRRARRISTWDSPWLNQRFLVGLLMLLAVILFGILGPFFWDANLAYVGSSPTDLPPLGFTNLDKVADPAHPLGTENQGRDMLAIMIIGAPASLRVGFTAAGVGLIVGVILGSMAGYFGGMIDNVIRTISDSLMTIPTLAILIVISAHVRVVDLGAMSLILALFSWTHPTRLVRSQVLTLRERGYVRMAQLSGVPGIQIMIREMVPNMLPWLAASFAGGVSGAILAAASLEALGLGPTRIPTLGMTIYYSIRSSAILRGMWWWWGLPILALVIIFTALFLIATGLDEIANPRLRGLST
jgi:peptide/nickel transport system permease protein